MRAKTTAKQPKKPAPPKPPKRASAAPPPPKPVSLEERTALLEKRLLDTGVEHFFDRREVVVDR
ncbi:MAG: hypothetical protein ABI183_03945, partial [Polyangiaceae bacterium]